MKKQLVALLCALVSVLNVAAQDVAARDWRKDVQFFGEELPRRHFNLFAQKSESEFRKEVEEVAERCRQCSKLELAVRLQQVLAGLGDTHTAINFAQYIDGNRTLPVGLAGFGDDYVVLSTTEEYARLLGWNLVAVNGRPIKEVEQRFCSLVTVDNVSNVRSLVPLLLSFSELHNLLGVFEGDHAELTFAKNGVQERVEMSVVPLSKARENLQTKDFALCIRNKDQFFTEELIDNGAIYYVQYNKCWGRELEAKLRDPKLAEQLPAFQEFADRVRATISGGTMQKVVFDLRYNSGGSSAQFTELVEQLAEELGQHPDLKIYCVVGRETFSSGILNALDLKLKLDARLVGEPTAGKPNHFGEVRSFRLPDSEIEVRYSTKYFKMLKNDMPTLAPDVEIDLTVEDYVSGVDPVLEWVRAQ